MADDPTLKYSICLRNSPSFRNVRCGTPSPVRHARGEHGPDSLPLLSDQTGRAELLGECAESVSAYGARLRHRGGQPCPSTASPAFLVDFKVESDDHCRIQGDLSAVPAQLEGAVRQHPLHASH